MHKVLKDYITTSQGDLLLVVTRITDMILNQFGAYQKKIATARHTTKFQHKHELLPFLPAGIHNIITPAAIELIRQQDLLRKKDVEQPAGRKPCTGSFTRIYGLPCRHTLQSLIDIGSPLQLNCFEDDHWRYQRQHQRLLPQPPRPHHDVLEPLSIQGRGRPRKNEASTRRDPSAFEQPAPRNIPHWLVPALPPALPRTPPPARETLADALRQTSTALWIESHQGLSSGQASPGRSEDELPELGEILAGARFRHHQQPSQRSPQLSPIQSQLTQQLLQLSEQLHEQQQLSQQLSESQQRSQELSTRLSQQLSEHLSQRLSQRSSPPPSSPPPSRQSSQQSHSSQPLKNLLSWEEFCADIERHKQSINDAGAVAPNDMLATERYLKQTGQYDDHPGLVFAREQALATEGLYASYTTRMVYDYHFGNRRDFERVLMFQARSSMFDYLNSVSRPAASNTMASRAPRGRPKRRAAEQASAAWAGLSPQKRQRRAK